MSLRISWNFCLRSTALFIGTGLITPSAVLTINAPSNAAEPIVAEVATSTALLDSTADSETSPLTPVSQLSDVRPTDWAFQSLTQLSQRYGCLVGFPDGTFRGSRALTRYEFAAGLNACLDAIAQTAGNQVKREDLEQIRRLQQEFQGELATLRGRVDTLETQISELEANQFSATGKLNVLSSFNLSQAFAGGDVLVEGAPIPGSSPISRLPLRVPNPVTGQLVPLVQRVSNNPPATLSHSTYLVFTFSTTGEDVLSTILAAGNGDPPVNAFASAGFTSTFGVPYADSNPVVPLPANTVGLFELTYAFPIMPSVRLLVGPRILGFRYFDVNLYTNVLNGASGLNFYQSTLANSGLSGAGAIATWTINPQFSFQAGYLSRNDASLGYFRGDSAPDPVRGLFNGSYSILAELTYSPSSTANLRLLYTRAHIQAPPLPSSPFQPPLPLFLTNSIRGAVDDGFGGPLNDVNSDNFVFNFDWLITKGLALFGRYSFSSSQIKPVNPLRSGGNANVQAFELGLAFPDLGRQGALATLAAAIPYNILSGRRFFVAGNGDGGTQVDVMASYYYPLNNYVAIVPMFFATFNANNFNSNPNVYSAVLRTQFLF